LELVKKVTKWQSGNVGTCRGAFPKKNLNRDFHDSPGLPGLETLQDWFFHGNHLIMGIYGIVVQTIFHEGQLSPCNAFPLSNEYIRGIIS